MKRDPRLTVTLISRILFLGTFALVSLFALSPAKRESTVSVKNTNPVFFHTEMGNDNIKAATTDENEVYVLSETSVPLPSVSAEGAALISGDTGELIYGKGSNKVLPMASTTKIMTALLVLESGTDLSELVTVPREAVGVEGSSIYLFEGEKITVRDLLYGLLLESGNDAATALAIAVGGSVEAFVSKMNEKAAELGLTATSFKNPHGLSCEGHKTTAYELAVITYHAMKNEVFREIVGTKNYSTESLSEKYPSRYFVNHNRMLRLFDGANGVKTGYTIASGRCLVTSADRGDGSFIAVTLNDRNDWKDHAAMLDFALSSYKCKQFLKENTLTFSHNGVTYKNPTPVLSLLPSSPLSFSVVLYPE